MADIVKAIANNNAPGVFFAAPPTGVVGGSLVKTGTFNKLGRGRGLVSAVVGKKWAERTFRVYEDMTVQYYDKDTLKGEFSVKNAHYRKVPTEEADGKEFAFEISCYDGEKILLTAETDSVVDEWIEFLKLISSGRWGVLKHLEILKTVLQLPQETRFSLITNDEELTALIVEDGYTADRLNEILSEYLTNLVQKVHRFQAEDNEFAGMMKSRWSTLAIRIVRSADKDTSKGYYKTYFNDAGEIVIEAKKAWTNVSYLGEDLADTVSSDPNMPYTITKTLRKYKYHLEAHMTVINNMLRTSGITYDYSLAENLAAMRKNNNYSDDRFGEIFLDEHLKALVESLRGFITQDYSFPESFVALIPGKQLIIRPSTRPDSMRTYYDSSITADGKLLIEYRDVWCNISQLGKDFLSLLNASDGNYLANKSIRENNVKMNAYLQVIAGLLQTSNVTYDYSLQENLAAMKRDDYGDDRFGEIFLDEHLKALIEKLRRYVSEDAGFAPAFNRKFTAKKIIIRPAKNADAVKNYYDASFTPAGELLIEYRRVWCNLHNLGQDLPNIL